MNISFNFSRISSLSSRRLMIAWYRSYKMIFFLLFLVTLALAGYQWYFNLHRYAWSEAEKKAYLEAHFKETNFKEEEFKELTERLRKRSAEHAVEPAIKRNIFTGEYIGK